MAGHVRFWRLADDFIERLEVQGATVLRKRNKDDERPCRFRVISSDGQRDFAAYLWNVTPGGGPGGERPAHERRIQLTQVTRIPISPDYRTLLGGWSEEFGVYVFWDARRHQTFSSKSPSLQVHSKTLEEAHQKGLATHVRPSNQGTEVVVAVHPDFLLWYVLNGELLHDAGDEADETDELITATPEDERQFIDTSENEGQTIRRLKLVETLRAYRDAKFRPEVLRAYKFRCAVCQYALKLVDAAHIVPVRSPGSTDEVTNGLALCRLHHGAYDNALLGIRSDYSVIVNPDATKKLADIKLDSGLEDFKARLPDRIVVPTVIEVRPDPRKLILGLKLRQWPESMVG